MGYLFVFTNSWLITFGRFVEGQCKVHADRAGALQSASELGVRRIIMKWRLDRFEVVDVRANY